MRLVKYNDGLMTYQVTSSMSCCMSHCMSYCMAGPVTDMPLFLIMSAGGDGLNVAGFLALVGLLGAGSAAGTLALAKAVGGRGPSSRGGGAGLIEEE